MDNDTDISKSIHATSTLTRDISIIVGAVVIFLSFFITRPEFSALAEEQQEADKATVIILKKILTTQCKFARVNDKLTQDDIDEACKQL